MTALTKDTLTLAANTVRMLSADGVEKANSGHPGMPMGVADYGVVLWLNHLRYNPKDPHWLNRDRFVLSNGHGSMFLYSMLHLAGYDLSLSDLKEFRQWESKTPGHPEVHITPGVEATTGPLGQGISNAVGMAIGKRVMAERYNTPEFAVIDHKIYVFCGDGCLMEGVSSEASSLAGHLGLGEIIVLYDDNHISIAGHTELAFTEDVLKRYDAYGWHTTRVDGHDFAAIDQAITAAKAETGRPSMIALRTVIGKGSPNKKDTHDVHGAPLGKTEMELTKKALNWPLEPTFFVPEEVRALFAARAETLSKDYQEWQSNFAAWSKKEGEKAAAFERQVKLTVPADLTKKLIDAVQQSSTTAVSTRKLSGDLLQVASKEVSSLLGGSADLEPSTLTLIKGSSDIQRGESAGLNLRFGVREHGMGAIMNGLSYYGGFIPYGSTFLCFSDYMRPTIRLAALSNLPGLFIYTHDSVFLGEDGPTHQPIEHLNSLRMMPNVQLFRPADWMETAVCYSVALQRRDGPAVMVFTRQNLDPIERGANFDPAQIAHGGYVAYESAPNPEIVFGATGSEVSLAIAAAKKLTQRTRVVSLPCVDLFLKLPHSEQRKLFPSDAKKVTVEAGVTFGWREIVGGSESDTLCIGIDRFGASAPAKIISEKLGFTPEAIVSRIKEVWG